MKKSVLILPFILLALQPPCSANPAAEKKSLFWMPLASIVLPGLGQAIDGETGKFLLFAGQGTAGILVAAEGRQKEKDYLKGPDLDDNYRQDTKLQQDIGSSAFTNAGLISAFDTFNRRVKVSQKEGQFRFLPQEQDLATLYRAPFDFSYMKKPTTWIPFLLAMGIGYEHLMQAPRPGQIHTRGIDGLAGAYLSYNAGTGEEAYFRGVLYPTLYENWNGHWTANAAQSLLFGYSHGATPYFQILAGWYLGWVTEKNGFELGESIFIHAWWDLWVITASFIRNRSLANDVYIQLPQLEIRF